MNRWLSKLTLTLTLNSLSLSLSLWLQRQRSETVGGLAGGAGVTGKQRSNTTLKMIAAGLDTNL